MSKVSSLRRLALAALLLWVSASTQLRAEDIDIYTDNAAGGVPNVLFVIDNGANFNANAGSPCTAYNSGGAPSLGSSGAGVQQCALVNAIEALPNGTVNVGLLVGNAKEFAKGYGDMVATQAAFYNTCDQSTGYGGCVIRPLTLMTADAKANLIAFIKSWRTSGDDTATTFKVSAGGNKTANMMQEAWAYYNGRQGLSGRQYGSSVVASGCQKNFIIFIANAAGVSGTPADTPEPAETGVKTQLDSSTTDATLRTKLTETATFPAQICGVPSLVAQNQPSDWSSNWMDEWARLMYKQDGNATGDGAQNVRTYTIGITGANCKPDYPALLWSAARNGGGRFFNVNSAVTLTEAITAALNEIQAVNSVFSSASLPVSVNAQGTFLNQVFLGKFRPDAGANPRWLGNLKQYQFVLVGSNPLTAELQLGDKNGNSAISSSGTGFISPNAVSFWTTDSASVRDSALQSLAPTGYFAKDDTAPLGRDGYDSPDGELVERGGVAQRLRIENLTATFSGAASTSNPRRLYTYCPAGSICASTAPSNNLTDLSNQLSTSNANIPAVAFGDSVNVRILQIIRSGSTATVTTAGAHGFAPNSAVDITGAPDPAFNGSKTLVSASGSTFTFAVADFPTTPAQGAYYFSKPSAGATSVSVTSMARSTSAVGSTSETVTVKTSGHSFAANSIVTVSGANPEVYNGNKTISLPNSAACPAATCFTFDISPIYPVASATGFSAVVVPYTRTVQTITVSGTNATVTTSTAHGFHAGQRIRLTNTGQSAYDNLEFTVSSGNLTSTSFRFSGFSGTPASVNSGSVSPATTPEIVSVSRTSTGDAITVTATGASSGAFGDRTGATKTLNISKASFLAGEKEFAASPVTVTCSNNSCSTFTYTVAASPVVNATGTITVSAASTNGVLIAAGGVTRVDDKAFVTGAPSGLFGTSAGQTAAVNVSTSGSAFPNEAAYVGSGSLTITCLNAGCTEFSYPVTQTPALQLDVAEMTAYQAGTSPDRDTLVRWIRGQDNFGDERGPGGSVTVRPSIHGDVIHSRPLVVNYGDSRGIVVFYGANDGVFRAVNGNKTTGDIGGVPPGGEIWGLVLPEHFPQFNRLRTNSPELRLPNTLLPSAERKDYFVDGSTGAYQKLKADGTIDKAILYLTMRRGGRFIYALDVTQPTQPTVLWVKRSTDTGFEELGQTWSRPRITVVKGYANPVVVFGAGYDPAEDDEPPSAGSMGRGMFVLDAISGNLLWSAGPTAGTETTCTGSTTQASCAVVGMNWAVPSDISFVDRDNDGYTDRFYFGDMGGNVWRVDLEPGTGTPTGAVNTWRVSKLAALGCDSGTCASGTTPRKFFFPPSVLFAPDYDLLMISSGDREHPLRNDATFRDRLFGIKDLKTGKDASTGGLNAAIALSGLKNLGAVTNTTQTLYDGTLSGYHLGLAQGEKGVNAPVTTRGTTFFGTNRPKPPTANQCSANLGEARGYAVNPFTGAFGVTTFEGGGLPPTATTGIVAISWLNPSTGETTEVRRQFCVGCGSAVPPGTTLSNTTGPKEKIVKCDSALEGCDLSPGVSRAPRRTYWYRR